MTDKETVKLVAKHAQIVVHLIAHYHLERLAEYDKHIAEIDCKIRALQEEIKNLKAQRKHITNVFLANFETYEQR